MATFSVQMDGSANYTLTLTVTQTSQNVTANTSNLSWSLVAAGTNGSWGNYSTSYSVNIGGQVYSGTIPSFNPNPSQTIRSGSTTITHNADGTKTVSVSGYWDSRHARIGKGTASGSFALTTIPRASTSTWATSGTKYAGSTYQINTNRASTSFTHTLEYKVGTASGVINTGVGASTNWTIPLSLLNETPNSPTISGTIITKTYNGSTLIGTRNSSMVITAPTNVIPTWTSVSATEAVPLVASEVGAYVQGVSKIAYAINGAAGVYGSTITSRKFEVAGQTVEGATGTTPQPISASGTVPAKFTVTDSRGRVKTLTQNLTVLPYSTPTVISHSEVRALSNGTAAPDSGTYLKVTVNASVASLINGTQKNSIQIKVRAKPRGSTTSWTDPSTLKHTLNPGGRTYNGSFTVTGPFAVDTSYDVRVEVVDLFNVTPVQTNIPVAAVFMHWDGATGVGVGKYRENGRLDVNGDTYTSGFFYQKGRKLLSLQQVIYYTSSGTFTKASYPWLQAIRVRLVGGGGGGGGSQAAGSGAHSQGGGGGGGGYAESFIYVSSLTASETVTVGAGGGSAAGSNGGNGGTSSFGSLVSAVGGGAGATSTSSGLYVLGTPGGGGYGTAGDFISHGDTGQFGAGYATLGSGGGGGGSYLGGGGRPTYTGAGGGTVTGEDGRLYGGGGAGGSSNAGGGAVSGGLGAPGIVIVELYA